MKKAEGRARGENLKNAQEYIALMTRHIQKENHILFPMLDRLLAKKKQKEVVDGFEELERRKIGTHEEFHKFLHQLRDVYLR